MADSIEIADNFWNLRGSFKVGPVDIGTHASLVKLASGQFIFLDSYTLSQTQKDKVNALTNNGKKVAAVLNLHPFHTLHVEAMAEAFPKARFYGTQRHIDKFPSIKWESLKTEDFEIDNPFQGDLEFTTPKGVDFISDNESIHFSSVLAFHPESKTVHVNDTFNIVELPETLDALTKPLNAKTLIQFHPTLPFALEKRCNASDEFLDWVERVCEPWFEHALNLCAAHSGVFIDDGGSGLMGKKVARAKLLVRPVLALHRLRYG